MNYHTIITHEYPDLDAMLCCYLLRYYGNSKYPGIDQAEIKFVPGGQLPKSPEELEKEGILAVDIGGGKLDTHPSGMECEREKFEQSAANLVATDLEIHEYPTLKNLLEFTRLQDSTGQSLRSRNPIDHSLALPNLIKGGLFYFGEKFLEMTHFFMQIFSAIEIASQHEAIPFPLNDSQHLIALDANFAYLPKNYNFHSLYVAYLSQKFLGKKLITDSIPSQANSWTNLNTFLIGNGFHDRNELQKINTFMQNLQTNNYLLNSQLPVDQTVSVPYILKGFSHLYNQDLLLMMPLAATLFDCIIAYENVWQEAIEEYKQNCKLYTLGKLKIVVITAKSGIVSKIARWQDRADLIVFQDSLEGHLSISINKLGRLQNGNLSRLAARLRVAELICQKENQSEITLTEMTQIGEKVGWFLHQSLKLLVHGSPKAKREPSKIPFDLVVQLTLSEFQRENKLPDTFCPPQECYLNKCPFYPLRLSNCFVHRQKFRPIDVETAPC